MTINKKILLISFAFLVVLLSIAIGSLDIFTHGYYGEEVQVEEISLQDFKGGEQWYKVYTSANLKKGKEYTLIFTAEECATIPHIPFVDENYLPEETMPGNTLISYAYDESTFTLRNNVRIILFILSIWIMACLVLADGRVKKGFRWLQVSYVLPCY